jgi:hypothetical protein
MSHVCVVNDILWIFSFFHYMKKNIVKGEKNAWVAWLEFEYKCPIIGHSPASQRKSFSSV